MRGSLKILVVGGGSGGHITPVLAVAHELKQLRPEVSVVYVGQLGDALGDIPEQDDSVDQVVNVRAGKFRRYHGEGWKQFFDVVTLYKNLRDVFWVVVGIWQSYRLLGRVKPSVVFIKGGFVGVPVGLAAAIRRIPYVTHDSDALPGLANRAIAPWAKMHAVALPKEVYTSYPAGKTVTVGVPISRQFREVTAKDMHTYRQHLELKGAGQVLLLTGGGNGADRLNQALLHCVSELFERYPDLHIVHLAGRALEVKTRQLYEQLLSPAQQKRVLVRGFVTNLHEYSGAADVVITRAGMTSLTEFAAQAKACVVVPNPQLTGGHQLKNAEVLANRKAVRLVSEANLKVDPKALMPALTELLDDPKKAQTLGARFSDLMHPDAAHELATLVIQVAEGKTPNVV